MLSGMLTSFVVRASALKRMSAHFPGRRLGASMTVEACFVLPFFLFAFLNVISIVELYRLQGNMSLAMHETAKQMAVYGYEYKELEGKSVLTYFYAAAKVRAKLGEAYLDSAPLANGFSSISWLRSAIMCGDDIIDLVAEYRIAPPIAVVGYPERVLYNRIRTRAWTGYDNAGSGGGGTGGRRLYISRRKEVYTTVQGRAAISNCRFPQSIWIFLPAGETRMGKNIMPVKSVGVPAETQFILQIMETGITRHWAAAS